MINISIRGPETVIILHDNFIKEDISGLGELRIEFPEESFNVSFIGSLIVNGIDDIISIEEVELVLIVIHKSGNIGRS